MVCAEESVGANKMIASNKAFNDFFVSDFCRSGFILIFKNEFNSFIFLLFKTLRILKRFRLLAIFMPNFIKFK